MDKHITPDVAASALHEQTDRAAGIAHATADGLRATASPPSPWRSRRWLGSLLPGPRAAALTKAERV